MRAAQLRCAARCRCVARAKLLHLLHVSGAEKWQKVENSILIRHNTLLDIRLASFLRDKMAVGTRCPGRAGCQLNYPLNDSVVQGQVRVLDKVTPCRRRRRPPAAVRLCAALARPRALPADVAARNARRAAHMCTRRQLSPHSMLPLSQVEEAREEVIHKYHRDTLGVLRGTEVRRRACHARGAAHAWGPTTRGLATQLGGGRWTHACRCRRTTPHPPP